MPSRLGAWSGAARWTDRSTRGHRRSIVGSGHVRRTAPTRSRSSPSPTRPTAGAIPGAAGRTVSVIEYRADSNGRRNSLTKEVAMGTGSPCRSPSCERLCRGRRREGPSPASAARRCRGRPRSPRAAARRPTWAAPTASRDRAGGRRARRTSTGRIGSSRRIGSTPVDVAVIVDERDHGFDRRLSTRIRAPPSQNTPRPSAGSRSLAAAREPPVPRP